MTEIFGQTEYFNGKKGKVMVEHQLWGTQVFRCETVQIINDGKRLGAVINGHDVYVNVDDLLLYKAHKNMLVIADKTVQITVIVNKL